MKILVLLAALFAIPTLATAQDDFSLLPARWLPAGVYGGHAATLNVTRRAADLDLSCAHGHIPYRPALSSRGTFVAEGTWTSGPIVRPGTPPTRATFRGRVSGNTLWLDVIVHGRGRIERQSYGPLVFGHQEFFVRCL
jgi:hypothetical protein